MARYTIETDNIFLRCCDKGQGLTEVYEISSLDIPLIEEKHWTKHETIRLGRRKEYTVLKMGDLEISGRDLDKVMGDLYDSRCMVNRGGLCILPTGDLKSESHFDVEYYRLFDLFNWSNCGIKESVTTNSWRRSDILTGRPTLAHAMDPERERLEQTVTELEKKLSEVMSKHKLELSEVISKHQRELSKLEKEVMKKKEMEISELLKKHEIELEVKNKRIAELEAELKLREMGDSISGKEFMTSMVERVRVPYLSVAVTHKDSDDYTGWVSRMVSYNNQDKYESLGTVMDTCLSKEMISSLSLDVESRGDFDRENWWAVKLSGFDISSSWSYSKESYLSYQAYYGTFIYYDGTCNTRPIYPAPNFDGCRMEGYKTIYLQGIGPRLGKFIPDDNNVEATNRF